MDDITQIYRENEHFMGVIKKNMEKLERHQRKLKKQIDSLDSEAKMTVTAIAEHFGKDRSTIYRWIKKGKLKSKAVADVIKLQQELS